MSIQNINRLYWFFAGIGVLVLLMIPFMYMDQLPDQIPMHYGADGMPDRFGNKTGIWTLPIVGLIIFVTMSLLGHYAPIKPRDMKKHSEEGHREQLRLNVHLLGLLNVFTVWLFAYIVYRTVMVAMGKASGLGGIFLPIILILIFIPMIDTCWRISQVDK